jgi:hypothetical protein
MSEPRDKEAVAAEEEDKRQRAQNERAERTDLPEGTDPASMAGQQNAMARGEAVQLRGEDGLRGVRRNIRATSNESVPVRKQDGPNYVTGDDGFPRPAGDEQQVYGDVVTAEQDKAGEWAVADPTPEPEAKTRGTAHSDEGDESGDAEGTDKPDESGATTGTFKIDE